MESIVISAILQYVPLPDASLSVEAVLPCVVVLVSAVSPLVSVAFSFAPHPAIIAAAIVAQHNTDNNFLFISTSSFNLK